jgi:hypothetical protein
MEQPIVSPQMYQRIQAAAHDLQTAMKKAHLTPRQIKDVSVAMEEYFREMQQIVAEEQVSPTATAPTPQPSTKTGWTEEDLAPFIAAGAQRIGN